MTIICRLIDGNGIKSGETLNDLVEEGWVEFIEGMDLSYEVDTNQLNDIIYECYKWTCMARMKPTSGLFYERFNSDSFKEFQRNRK